MAHNDKSISNLNPCPMTSFPCGRPKCMQEFDTMDGRDKHEKTRHPEMTIYQCKLCSKEHTSKANKGAMLRNRHEDDVHVCGSKFICLSCNKYYTTERTLMDHVCSSGFPCQVCEREFATEGYLREHITKSRKCRPPQVVTANTVGNHAFASTASAAASTSSGSTASVGGASSSTARPPKHKNPQQPPSPQHPTLASGPLEQIINGNDAALATFWQNGTCNELAQMWWQTYADKELERVNRAVEVLCASSNLAAFAFLTMLVVANKGQNELPNDTPECVQDVAHVVRNGWIQKKKQGFVWTQREYLLHSLMTTAGELAKKDDLFKDDEASANSARNIGRKAFYVTVISRLIAMDTLSSIEFSDPIPALGLLLKAKHLVENDCAEMVKDAAEIKIAFQAVSSVFQKDLQGLLPRLAAAVSPVPTESSPQTLPQGEALQILTCDKLGAIWDMLLTSVAGAKKARFFYEITDLRIAQWLPILQALIDNTEYELVRSLIRAIQNKFRNLDTISETSLNYLDAENERMTLCMETATPAITRYGDKELMFLECLSALDKVPRQSLFPSSWDSNLPLGSFNAQEISLIHQTSLSLGDLSQRDFSSGCQSQQHCHESPFFLQSAASVNDQVASLLMSILQQHRYNDESSWPMEIIEQPRSYKLLRASLLLGLARLYMEGARATRVIELVEVALGCQQESARIRREVLGKEDALTAQAVYARAEILHARSEILHNRWNSCKSCEESAIQALAEALRILTEKVEPKWTKAKREAYLATLCEKRAEIYFLQYKLGMSLENETVASASLKQALKNIKWCKAERLRIFGPQQKRYLRAVRFHSELENELNTFNLGALPFSQTSSVEDGNW